MEREAYAVDKESMSYWARAGGLEGLYPCVRLWGGKRSMSGRVKGQGVEMRWTKPGKGGGSRVGGKERKGRNFDRLTELQAGRLGGCWRYSMEVAGCGWKVTRLKDQSEK